MAGWKWWRRGGEDEAGPPAPVISPELSQRVRARALELTVSCLRIAPGVPVADPTASFAGGHAYLPAGRQWPVIDGEPAAFVCQVNFAQVRDAGGPVPGFPGSGLLQWFCASDDLLGLTFEETAGADGFEVRWYDDLTAPSVAAVDAPVPRSAEHYDPMDVAPGTALVFTPGRSLGPWDSLPAGVQAEPLWQEWADAVDFEDPEEAFDLEVTASDGPLPEAGMGSKIGGHASFTQEDPRGSGAYLPAQSSGGRLLIELDAEDFGGWGDAGIGHLFGDPEALARGDLSSIRYHWDCA